MLTDAGSRDDVLISSTVIPDTPPIAPSQTWVPSSNSPVCAYWESRGGNLGSQIGEVSDNGVRAIAPQVIST